MSEEFEVIDLPGGQQVKVYPDGSRYLVKGVDRVTSTVSSEIDNGIVESESLRQNQFDELSKKKGELSSGGLPSEKSPI